MKNSIGIIGLGFVGDCFKIVRKSKIIKKTLPRLVK
jgi:hypothetical protein